MKLAVMQPYLFPYLGYYQLCNAVDKFVFYDDVTYIKQGYINRNSIVNNENVIRFTIPVPGASSNMKIKDLSFSNDTRKILETIKQSYSKAEYFHVVYPMIESVFQSPERNVASVCKLSIQKVFEYIGLEKEFYMSSDLNYDRSANAADRLVEIAKQLKCIDYINSPGGIELYNKDYFLSKEINLSFIKMDKIEYKQLSNSFKPNLSMIDVLMNCNKSTIKDLLDKYILV